jgi:hypothetical protein
LRRIALARNEIVEAPRKTIRKTFHRAAYASPLEALALAPHVTVMAKPPPNTPRLPPLVPATRVALDRAILLLGNRSKGEDLRASKIQELVGLLGRYPDRVTALAWKTELKRLREDEIFDHVG